MKKLLFIALLTFASRLLGEIIYLSDAGSGAGTGADTSNRASALFFNTAGNWSSPTKVAGKIGPGDTVSLGGTCSTQLVYQASGTSGNQITLLFESGAKLSAPRWSIGSSDAGASAINFNGKNFVTIDGGTNGLIEATDTGTAKTYQDHNVAMYAENSHDVVVKNLTVTNMYDRTAFSATDANRVGFAFQGGYGSNITLQDCVFSGGDTMITMNYGSGSSSSYSNWLITRCTISNCNHGINTGVPGGGPTNANLTGYEISHCIINDLDKWGPISGNHLDGIIIFNEAADHSGTLTNIYIHHNKIGPNIGLATTPNTSAIFMDGYVTTQFSNLRIWDNFFIAAIGHNWATGYISLGGVSDSFVVYNTFVSLQGTSYGVGTKITPSSANVTHKYNLYYYVGTGINAADPNGSSNWPSGFLSDYCIYWSSGSDWFGPPNLDYHPISDWRTASIAGGLNLDAHSVVVQPSLDGSYIPTSGDTVARDQGTTISWVTDDFNGVARDGTPDIGAFEYTTGAPTIYPPARPRRGAAGTRGPLGF